MRKFLLVVPLLLLALPAGAAEKLATTIQKNNDAFAAAFNKGDAAGVAQMYTEQATILPAGAPTTKGRDGAKAFWDGAIKAGIKNMALTAVAVDPMGRSMAREIGNFSFDIPAQGGNAGGRAEGKYVVIWKKIGAKWLLDTDIWNTNK